MSTYHQNFRSEPYPRATGPGRRGRRRRSIADPRDAFRRRLGAMVLLGLLLAPVVWATRNDGKPVGVAYTGGAAAVVQFDPSAGSASAPPVVAPPEDVQVPTSPAPAPEDLIPVDEPVETEPPQNAVAQTAAAVVQCLSYTVQLGDSWYGIAEKAGVKAGEIAGRNGMTLQSNLLVGSEICLPPGATVPPIKTTVAPQTTQAPKCSGQYTVKAGDSWSLIASRHSVTSTELASVNDKKVRSTLLIGDVLCLPVGAKAPAATSAPRPSSGGSSSGPTRTYTRAELEQIVRDAWPDELERRAFYVVDRESRWTPNVKNAWPSRENPCCYGLFQINWTAHKSWLKDHGVTTPTQLFDPVVNAKMAYVIYQRAGSWQPWWTSGWRPTD